MISNNFSPSMAMSVFSAAGIWSIVNDICAGWLSESCSSRLGRRRPFILYFTLVVIVANLCLYVFDTFHYSWMNPLVFVGFMLVDSSLWTLEAPKTSYLLEVFNLDDQNRVLNGNVFFTGLGGVIGFLTSHVYGQEVINTV